MLPPPPHPGPVIELAWVVELNTDAQNNSLALTIECIEKAGQITCVV